VEAEFTLLSVAVDPLGGAGAGYAHFRGEVGDRAVLAALDEALAPLEGQRGVTVGHRRVFLGSGEFFGDYSSCRGRPVLVQLSPRPSVNNLMTRNI
jgi:hypothetical protein